MLKRNYYGGSALALAAALIGATLFGGEDKSASDAGQHYRAKQILGAKVSLEGNTSVGTVDDIVLDEGGNVDYLIVVNSDNKLVTVPFDATMFNVEKRTAVVHIAPEKFQQVPTYTTDSYPVWTAPYRTQVYKYYGLTPGQQRRAFRRGVVVP